MPTKQELRVKLIKKLQELFQLDQPDLDFGFYRIMHAKAKQVTAFLEKDLFKIVEDAFADAGQGQAGALKAVYEKAVADAIRYKADPDNSEPVLEAKAAYEAAMLAGDGEAEVYEHLYRFFERYYEDGDFISRRYLVRETDHRAAPFAIPYHGEEVKLHWANSDQYYIKTTEHFRNYSFDLRAAVKKELGETAPTLFEEDQGPLMVHFRLVDAEEGEHGNVKETKEKSRHFVLRELDPIGLDDQGELEIRFEYRSNIEKKGKDSLKREFLNDNATGIILEAMPAIHGWKKYLSLFQTKVPTETKKDRTVLRKYLALYTARNTMDYFVHKNLSGFLRRELDFFLKNEVMQLDDIASAEGPAVNDYLKKLKVIRKIAHIIIDFLTQLEEFQKKLWLKKKFVIGAEYCITLDRVPKELYVEIITNQAQIEEWISLFSIDKIQPDLMNPGFSKPLTTDFLNANPSLVLDTRFFNEVFKANLIASIENIDEKCNGLLVHSENFQALEFLRGRYNSQVRCTYIDPPYNTASTPILYKNEYRHSSWASLMWDRLAVSRNLLESKGTMTIAIDDAEMVNLSKIVEEIFSEYRMSKITVVHNPKGSITKDFNRVHEYALFLTKEDDKKAIARTLEKNKKPRRMRRWGENSLRTERRLSFYPIYVKEGEISRVGEVPSDDYHPGSRNVTMESGEVAIWPIDQDGIERRWNFGLDSINSNLNRIVALEVDNTLDLFLTHELTVPKTVWSGGEFDAGNYGNTLLINILGAKKFDFPKSINLVKRCISLSTANFKNAIVLDFFGGSGTTAHATIDLNKEDGGNRKYIMVEMGNHFETVLKPRVSKVIYSPEWKGGKPLSRSGTSHFYKYIRLESYEDTLNNLEFDSSSMSGENLEASSDVMKDFLLHYMLDLQTEGSASLLNVDGFSAPMEYKLNVKNSGSEANVIQQVDLLETFNYLIGLRVVHIAAPEEFEGKFKREHDPELPTDQTTRLVLDGKLKPCKEGKWWFRKVEGWVPSNLHDPNNGGRENVLIVWRKLSDDLEKDNVMLDEWFKKYRIDTQDREFDRIYVNGSNNLPNLKREGDRWTVELIEGEFHRRMWDIDTN